MKKKQAKSKYIPQKKSTKQNLVGLSVIGKLDLARNGIGYVAVDGWQQDIIVRESDLKSALNGDEVKVKITYVSGKGRAEGFITDVVKRNQTAFVGKVQIAGDFGFVIPNNRAVQTDIFLPPAQIKNLNNGDTVMVKIVEWKGNSKRKNPVGEVVEVLSQEGLNSIAMKEILVECGFPTQFPEVVMKETEALPDAIDPIEIALRRDMRDVLTFTIDPVDAKDFDDAISYKDLGNGKFEIGVHIADVSHYVKLGSELDKEAYTRATSVYLPDRVNPMLPEKISNELCSLRPNEDKLTFSAVFEMNHLGVVSNVWLGRTVTHSDRRYTYEEVQEVIEGIATTEHTDILLKLRDITQHIRKQRFKKGAINFSSQEVRFVLDENGIPIGLQIKESKEAHQLIEELMLLANKHVAIFVGQQNVNGNPVPFPYRIHDVPDETKLGTFAAFAARFGYKLNFNSPEKIAASFNELLAAVKGKPEQHVLEQLGIRTMAKAEYSTQNIGHYGLGFQDYCHFTSPIRRYPDVMVHRVLQECLDEVIAPDKKMEIKSKHCSERERKAMEAERAGNKYKQVEYMQQFIGETFDAIISGVSSFGFWAETVAHKCEGLISIADLTDLDQFEFLETEYALVGMHTGIRFRIGDEVKIQVVATDLERRTIDFELVTLGTSFKRQGVTSKKEASFQHDANRTKKPPTNKSKQFNKKSKKK
jgi:ribonuclease R